MWQIRETVKISYNELFRYRARAIQKMVGEE